MAFPVCAAVDPVPQVPTSVRTIESVIDVPGWAPVTPYLNMAHNVPTTQVIEQKENN